MGVVGLATYLSSNPDRFASRLRLADTDLVIDSNNLENFLLNLAVKKSPIYQEDKYGCNLVGYSELVEKFFDNLLRCNVNPILVADGSASGKRHIIGLGELDQQVLVQRANDMIRRIQSLPEYRLRSEAPLIGRLQKVVYSETVARFGNKIQLHQVAYEANHLITKLANQLDCPVLAGDSDFIIYPLNKGFIMLGSLDYDYFNGYYDCYIYKREKFIENFANLKVECLPVLNVLRGWGSAEVDLFEVFIRDVIGRVDLCAEIASFKKLLRILKWLRGKTKNEAVNCILDTFEQDRRAEMAEFIEKLMSVYRHESSTDIEEQLERIYPTNQVATNADESPSRCLGRLFSQHDLSGPCLNIILGQPDHDMSFLSDFSQPSPYKLEFRPISVAMALLRPKSTDKMIEEGTFDQQRQIFHVFTRSDNQDDSGPTVGKFDITPMECMDRFGSLNWLDCYSMILLPRARKRQLLMDTFRYSEAELYDMERDMMRLFLRDDLIMEAATCMILVKYQITETNKQLDETEVASLLMMFFKLGFENNDINYDFGSQADFGKLNDIIERYQPERDRRIYQGEPELYPLIVHNILSLQAIYQSYCMLNNLLDNPCYTVKPGVWFNGPLMYRLMLVTRLRGLEEFHRFSPGYEEIFNRVMVRLQDSLNCQQALTLR